MISIHITAQGEDKTEVQQQLEAALNLIREGVEHAEHGDPEDGHYTFDTQTSTPEGE